MAISLDVLVAKSLDRGAPTVAAAGRVRRHFFGRRVKLNTIINVKSGMCPEDCNYCSQRLGSTSNILATRSRRSRHRRG